MPLPSEHARKPLALGGAPARLQGRAASIQKLLLKGAKPPRLFSSRGWRQKALAQVMSSDDFKARLFRFVDVLPELKGGPQIIQHLREYFQGFPVMGKALGLAALSPALAARFIEKETANMARIFIAGKTAARAIAALRQRAGEGLLFSMDILGEAALSDKEALSFQAQYLSLLDDLSAAAPLFEKGLAKLPFAGRVFCPAPSASAKPPAALPFTARRAVKTRPGGESAFAASSEAANIPLLEVSVKSGALSCRLREESFEFSKEELKARLRPLFLKAMEKGCALTLDMEMRAQKSLTFKAFQELVMEPRLQSFPHFGIALQAYLRESGADLRSLESCALKRGAPIRVRLVKGAYWDSELIFAGKRNWAAPVFTQKEDTDSSFEELARFLLERPRLFRAAIASHNPRSIAYALALQEALPDSYMEFQFLDGMGESLALAMRGFSIPVRIYTTAGDLISGMAYFVRRLLENTSSQSFVARSFRSSLKTSKQPPESGGSHAPPRQQGTLRQQDARAGGNGPQASMRQTSGGGPTNKALPQAGAAGSLKPPAPTNKSRPPSALPIPEKEGSFKGMPFSNHPEPDFTQEPVRERFQKALEGWKKRFPLEAPLLVGGKELRTSTQDRRINPGNTQEVIGSVHHALEKELQPALRSLVSFFPKWRAEPMSGRAERLLSLGRLIKEREMELAALEVYETGKPWREAVRDIAEAIDFCSYYARSLMELSSKQKTQPVLGEDNFIQYEPIGPAAIIAPWNFPLAILTGMTAAPLAAGNPVLIKPAEQSSLIAFELAKLLRESGFPPSSFAFLPGRGEKAGAWMVRHPEIPIISFTGSLAVGSEILREAAIIRPRQRHIKRCVAEMGGKNTVIVDESADFDEAVAGALEAAFGFQGQKCSACGIAVILNGAWDRFIKRLAAAVESVVTGPPELPESFMGPVIDEAAFRRIQGLLEKTPGLIAQGPLPASLKERGFYIPPSLFEAQDLSFPLLQEEIFGPVLTAIRADSLSAALALANRTSFGLTAGLYSRTPSHIERFCKSIEAGNVYINRSCAGAMVGRQPFGGIKLSGCGSKAGGPEYARQFLSAKVISENMTRKGFSPDALA